MLAYEIARDLKIKNKNKKGFLVFPKFLYEYALPNADFKLRQ